ncbi:MAG: hypothetical protein EKK42_08810 [Pseudonocardiaceae bacterium]|nr:MAG: hypothetical protein EKK42_08810 [Pseudonocardiaceae bacterium]
MAPHGHAVEAGPPVLTRGLGRDIARDIDLQATRADVLGGMVGVLKKVAAAPVPGSELRDRLLSVARRGTTCTPR